MTTILDPAFDADYNEEEDEDFVPDATELGEDDEDDGAVQRRLEQERLKKAIKHKSIEGAAILSDDEVDLFELPPEVEEDDLDHLTSTAAQREHSAAAVTTEERLTVEDQVRKARVEKMFEQLNEGRDTSGSLASLVRSSRSSSSSSSGKKRKSGSKSSGGGKRKTKRQKMKKTLNSWETPAAPLSVTELIQEAQQEAEEKDSGPESSKSEDGGGEKEEKKLQSLKDDDDDVQAIVGEEEVYLVKDVAEFAGEKIEMVREIKKNSAEERRLLRKKAKDNLDHLLESLEGGKSELTTIEKSSWDWQRDKREVGDSQELAQAAKDGYVAKQQFLAAAEERERQRRKQQERIASGFYR